MVRLSIMVEGQRGLTWARWKRLVFAVESLGFAGLFRSDHFTDAHPPDQDSLEMIVSLAYLADHTQDIHFGPLVAPLSMRQPTLLARQAVALDDLSCGRMILGIGAGWQEREHVVFGYTLGSVSTRFARMKEGLEVITRLFQSDEPFTFEGTFFHLRGATLLPRPQRPGGPPILIGGNGKRYTLPLVARYATLWNGLFLSLSDFIDLSALLDTLLQQVNRKPGDVKRTVVNKLVYGHNRSELYRQLSRRYNKAELADQALDNVITTLQSDGFLIGTPDMLVEQIKAYASAGVNEMIVRWLDLDDLDGLQRFAKSVLHQLR